MDKIIVQGMRFYGYHGVFPEENKLGQRFNVDLELHVDLRKAGLTDDLSHTINYAEAYEMTKSIVEGKPYKLVEALADKIASELLNHYATIDAVKVRVIKPDPPIAGHYDYVAVEIERAREE